MPVRSLALRLLLALALAVTLGPACSGEADGAGGGGGERGPGSSEPAPAPPAEPAELPVPRTEVIGTALGDGMIVVGGLTLDGGASDLVHLYDPRANAWREGPRLPVALHHSGMASLGGRAYLVGGYTNGPGQAWAPQAAVLSLGEGETTWRDEPALPSPRGALAVAAAGGRLVALGGELEGQPLATTVIYDPEARSWSDGPELSQGREHLAAAAVGDRVYAIAGRTAADGNFTVVESLRPGDEGWRRERELNDARGGIGADRLRERVCVAGGEEAAGTIASIECLGDDGWERVGRMARPRHGLAVVTLADGLHTVGGGESPGLFVSGTHEVHTATFE